MAAKERTRGNPVPLIVEEYPENYDGYPFLTLIQYRKQHIVTIVDNADEKIIKAFILDLCGPEEVDEKRIVEIAADWYYNRRIRYPISFEFSRLGLSKEAGRIFRTFNIEFVTRVIGPLPKFEMSEVHSVKRRRRKPVPPGMEVTNKLLTL